MNARLFVYSSLLCANALASVPGMAAKIYVKNDNEKPLDIVIRAEGNPLTENLHWFRATINGKAEASFEIDKEQMGGKNTFAVIGETNPLTPNGTCAPLSIKKNYNIKFTNEMIGTNCISTPKTGD